MAWQINEDNNTIIQDEAGDDNLTVIPLYDFINGLGDENTRGANTLRSPTNITNQIRYYRGDSGTTTVFEVDITGSVALYSVSEDFQYTRLRGAGNDFSHVNTATGRTVTLTNTGVNRIGNGMLLAWANVLPYERHSYYINLSRYRLMINGTFTMHRGQQIVFDRGANSRCFTLNTGARLVLNDVQYVEGTPYYGEYPFILDNRVSQAGNNQQTLGGLLGGFDFVNGTIEAYGGSIIVGGQTTLGTITGEYLTVNSSLNGFPTVSDKTNFNDTLIYGDDTNINRLRVVQCAIRINGNASIGRLDLIGIDTGRYALIAGQEASIVTGFIAQATPRIVNLRRTASIEFRNALVQSSVITLGAENTTNAYTQTPFGDEDQAHRQEVRTTQDVRFELQNIAGDTNLINGKVWIIAFNSGRRVNYPTDETFEEGERLYASNNSENGIAFWVANMGDETTNTIRVIKSVWNQAWQRTQAPTTRANLANNSALQEPYRDYWSENEDDVFSIYYHAYGYQPEEGTIRLVSTDGLAIQQNLRLFINPRITQTDPSIVEDYVIADFSHGTDVITMTGSRSLDDFYDYSQWEQTLSSGGINRADFNTEIFINIGALMRTYYDIDMSNFRPFAGTEFTRLESTGNITVTTLNYTEDLFMEDTNNETIRLTGIPIDNDVNFQVRYLNASDELVELVTINNSQNAFINFFLPKTAQELHFLYEDEQRITSTYEEVSLTGLTGNKIVDMTNFLNVPTDISTDFLNLWDRGIAGDGTLSITPTASNTMPSILSFSQMLIILNDVVEHDNSLTGADSLYTTTGNTINFTVRLNTGSNFETNANLNLPQAQDLSALINVNAPSIRAGTNVLAIINMPQGLFLSFRQSAGGTLENDDLATGIRIVFTENTDIDFRFSKRGFISQNQERNSGAGLRFTVNLIAVIDSIDFNGNLTIADGAGSDSDIQVFTETIDTTEILRVAFGNPTSDDEEYNFTLLDTRAVLGLLVENETYRSFCLRNDLNEIITIGDGNITGNEDRLQLVASTAKNTMVQIEIPIAIRPLAPISGVNNRLNVEISAVVLGASAVRQIPTVESIWEYDDRTLTESDLSGLNDNLGIIGQRVQRIPTSVQQYENTLFTIEPNNDDLNTLSDNALVIGAFEINNETRIVFHAFTNQTTFTLNHSNQSVSLTGSNANRFLSIPIRFFSNNNAQVNISFQAQFGIGNQATVLNDHPYTYTLNNSFDEVTLEIPIHRVALTTHEDIRFIFTMSDANTADRLDIGHIQFIEKTVQEVASTIAQEDFDELMLNVPDNTKDTYKDTRDINEIKNRVYRLPSSRQNYESLLHTLSHGGFDPTQTLDINGISSAGTDANGDVGIFFDADGSIENIPFRIGEINYTIPDNNNLKFFEIPFRLVGEDNTPITIENVSIELFNDSESLGSFQSQYNLDVNHHLNYNALLIYLHRLRNVSVSDITFTFTARNIVNGEGIFVDNLRLFENLIMDTTNANIVSVAGDVVDSVDDFKGGTITGSVDANITSINGNNVNIDDFKATNVTANVTAVNGTIVTGVNDFKAEFVDANLVQIEGNNLNLPLDVNLVNVSGAPVNSVDDFKADVTGLATPSDLSDIEETLEETRDHARAADSQTQPEE